MYDMEVLVPMCGRFRQRIEDFKRYGLVNAADRKVLVSLVLSNEDIEDIGSGWPDGFEVEVLRNESPNHVSNLYRFYTEIDPSSPRARWLVRLDDDSCTDIDGLLSNLDRFYDHGQPFYLGELNDFRAARCGGEHTPFEHYRGLLGPFEPIVDLMKNEIECGIMSSAAVSKMLNNDKSRRLLHKRVHLDGGFGDCVVALASAMAGVWPISCPFVTHLPLIHEFSLFGGVRNHIHQVARVPEGENFWGRCSPESYRVLVKRIENDPSEIERSVFGKRLLVENESCVKIIELKDNYTARIKLEHKSFNWYESKGELLVLDETEVIHRIRVGEDNTYESEGFSVKEI